MKKDPIEKEPKKAKPPKKEADPQLQEETVLPPAEGGEEAETVPPRSFSSRVLDATEVEQDGKKKDRKKLMRKFRKAKSIPSEGEVERFNPSIDKGLTQEQVETRFQQFLFNDVNKKYSKSYRSIFFGNLFTLFNLLCILAAAALIYAKAPITQFLFVGIFACNIVIGIVQEILAKKQVDKLAVLVSSNVKVMRNGTKLEIPIKELVLDDVIILEAGQQVPADCKLADGNVEVNESLLTGESIPIKKQIGDILYAGSFISSGSCRVIAEKVGKATYLIFSFAKDLW